MKQLVYRIEDKWGQGFYNTRQIDHEYRAKLHLFQKRHITPLDDIGIKRNRIEGEKSGFLNEKQLYSWIDKNKIRRLEKKGLKLVRLYRKVIAIGEYQLLFTE